MENQLEMPKQERAEKKEGRRAWRRQIVVAGAVLLVAVALALNFTLFGGKTDTAEPGDTPAGDAAGNNTYQMRNPVSKTGPGDGILVYPGSAYGQLDPIPSIRMLNMRDGIEDYQMLTMLEETKGADYTDELVSHITTSTLSFTRDDDEIYNVHAYLLRELEQSLAS